MGFGVGSRSFGRMGIVGKHGGTPTWVPTADGNSAALFADFTTEGSTNHYWYNKAPLGNFAALLSATSSAFSRASTAYYTNSSGLLTSASSNIARFDYDPISLVAKGLLLEGARTNSFLQSNAFSNASWANPATFTFSVNSDTGPDGTLSATRLIESTGNVWHHIRQTFSYTSGTTYAISVFAKAGSASRYLQLSFGVSTFNGYANFDLSAGTVTQSGGGATASIVAYPNGWYRCIAVYTATSTASDMPNIAMMNSSLATWGATYTGNGSSYIIISDAQFETGIAASSYIPTTTTTAQRAADNLVIAPVGVFNNTSASIFVIGQLRALDTQTVLASNGSANDQYFFSSGGNPGVYSYNSGYLANNLAFGHGGWTSGFKLGACWDASGRSVIAGNGAIASDAGNFSPATTTSVYIGTVNGANPIYGWINRLICFNFRVSAASLGILTA